jgi:hypothetical protein
MLGTVDAVIAAIKPFAKYLTHLTLPEIKDFNALSDALCLKLFAKRYNVGALTLNDGTEAVLVRPHFANALKLKPWPENRVEVGLPRNRTPECPIALLIRTEEINIDALAIFS